MPLAVIVGESKTFLELDKDFQNCKYVVHTIPFNEKKEKLFNDILESRNNPNKQDKPFYFKGDNNCNKLLNLINQN